MRREKEFKEYLEKNKITTKNVGYCRDHIEKAFGGKDMDEIIVKHQNISMVHDNLKALGEPDSSINAYMVALNHYLQFAIEQGTAASFVSIPALAATSASTISTTAPLSASSKAPNTPDPFEAIQDALARMGMKSAGAYCALLKRIMKEMGVTSIQELNQCIDEAIIYCDRKMEESTNDKDKNRYRDCRAALKKYREILMEGLWRDREQRNCGDFDEAWIDDLYIRYDKGWQSFVPVDEHVVGYCICGDQIYSGTNVGFGSGSTSAKKIARKHMVELIAILNEAYNYNLFADSNTCIKTVHGDICSYQYSYRGKSGAACSCLFKDNNGPASLQMRYTDLINKLIKL